MSELAVLPFFELDYNLNTLILVQYKFWGIKWKNTPLVLYQYWCPNNTWILAIQVPSSVEGGGLLLTSTLLNSSPVVMGLHKVEHDWSDLAAAAAVIKKAREEDYSTKWLLNKGTLIIAHVVRGFPHSSVGKESTCNEGNPCLIPGLGRSTGEGIGYPLQYSVMENSMDCQSMGS